MQALYFLFAGYVTIAAHNQMLKGLNTTACTLPFAVRAMWTLQMLCVPFLIAVVLFFWVFVFAVAFEEETLWLEWDIGVHGINAGLFLTDIFLTRHILHTKHMLVLTGMLGLVFGFWSWVHHALEIGVPEAWACIDYEVQRCPIYEVIDWHKPTEAAAGVALLILIVELLAVILSLISRTRRNGIGSLQLPAPTQAAATPVQIGI
eukprot:NODE_21105_length_768_cov_7.003120.p1 GENE.NODE_21105_length_768_cov_7.003120~~NODE_21105_length_768_cov_7.003120.p1  ORF type:complete len:205 (+),score=45.26 NODE_21105_length_768_cov_7.003120:72-686(+)